MGCRSCAMGSSCRGCPRPGGSGGAGLPGGHCAMGCASLVVLLACRGCAKGGLNVFCGCAVGSCCRGCPRPGSSSGAGLPGGHGSKRADADSHRSASQGCLPEVRVQSSVRVARPMCPGAMLLGMYDGRARCHPYSLVPITFSLATVPQLLMLVRCVCSGCTTRPPRCLLLLTARPQRWRSLQRTSCPPQWCCSR